MRILPCMYSKESELIDSLSFLYSSYMLPSISPYWVYNMTYHILIYILGNEMTRIVCVLFFCTTY